MTSTLGDGDEEENKFCLTCQRKAELDAAYSARLYRAGNTTRTAKMLHSGYKPKGVYKIDNEIGPFKRPIRELWMGEDGVIRHHKKHKTLNHAKKETHMNTHKMRIMPTMSRGQN